MMPKRALYCGNHGSILSYVITHHACIMPDYEAVLLTECTGSYLGSTPGLEKFEEQGLISKIMLISYSSLKKWNGKDVERRIIIDEIINEYDSVFRENGYDITKDFDYILTVNDITCDLAIYLTEKGIKHYSGEAFVNHFRYRPPNLKNSHISPGFPWYEIMKDYGVWSGFNDLITPVLLPTSVNPFPAEKHVEYFDLFEASLNLPQVILDKIANIFSTADFFHKLAQETNPTILFLLQNGAYCFLAANENKLCKDYFKEEATRYEATIQITLDYFTPDNSTVVLKTHPLNRLREEYFEEAVITDRLFDIKYMTPLMARYNYNFDYTITTASESVKHLDRNQLKREIHISNGWLWGAYLANRIFVILSMCRDLFPSKKPRIFESKPSKLSDYTLAFASQVFETNCERVVLRELQENSDVIINLDFFSKTNSTFWNTIAKNPHSVVFIPNSDTYVAPNAIHEAGLSEKYLRRRVMKTLKSSSLLSGTDEIFYIISNDKSVYSELRNYSTNKTLRFCKADISCRPTSESAQSHMRTIERVKWLAYEQTLLKQRLEKLEHETMKLNKEMMLHKSM